MSKMQLFDEFVEVFREVFDNPNLEINESTTAFDVEGWDSFAHINLIVALEERFHVEFSTQELSEMTCVGDTFNLLKSKL
jgi:acyl carrier protein